MSQRIQSLEEIVPRYQGIFCDVWGVLHNGQKIYVEAAHALARFRIAGGSVVLLTNSPRPCSGVSAQLADMGVPDGTFDVIVTSGDVTRDLVASGPDRVFHLGPERDLPLFDGLDVSLVPAAEAQAVVCTGLFDDRTESPQDYAAMLSEFRKRDLPFICANPDIVVEIGDRLVWCAGALARDYERLGGETRLAGKPHKPIYELALRHLNGLVEGIERRNILAIGDGMPTDVKGARDYGLDLLFVSAGIHAAEYGAADDPDESALQAFLAAEAADPTAWMPRLAWTGA